MKFFILILVLLFSFNCFYANNNKKVAICILNDKLTSFKQMVIDSLYKEHPDILFSNIPSNEILQIKQKEYDKIIIMDQLEAWTIFNRKLKKVSNALDPKKCIYIITAGDPEWKWKKSGLTTITSASKKSNISSIINQIRIELNRD